jgi:phosphoglycerol transferase MdoB-like AlkP superfamily enzyme
MEENISNQPRKSRGWLGSRYAFAGFCLLSYLVGTTVLRLVLLIAFKPEASFSELLMAFIEGWHRDLFIGLVLLIPFLVWCWVVPSRSWGRRWHRVLFWGGGTIICFIWIFLIFVEYFFFEEFKSRFNTVAVDYLLYPHEVFVNIWESYHVGIVIAFCGLMSVGWIWMARKFFGGMFEEVIPGGRRFGLLAGACVIAALLSFGIYFKGARVSTNRTVNELANNGAISFACAFWTHHLDYAAFYRTIDIDEAYARTRKMLAEPGTKYLVSGRSIRRLVEGDASRPKLNVVIVLEESLGSEFWGCLGRKNTLTPEMDKLALEEGILFTNLYASGNRTVRGMEGVLSSFPPLPGDSIVKRDLSDNVESLARVFKRDGYTNLFLYGGRGVFDSMRAYAVRNGYDSFIEQKHFDNPTFTTIWGVCDEDLFARGIEEFRELSKTGQPFFATLLTVSNHKPYTYPTGRIAEDPAKQKRNNAVKYTDYALGKFFRDAKKETFWTNTVFVVVADHGARVYGKQTIPIHSYEIPMVVLGPAVVKGPVKAGQLGCSLDVGPTILGMLGRPYESMFFGRDLFKPHQQQGRAWLNHNRDIGMLAGDRMVVLELMQGIEFYTGDPKKREMTPLEGDPSTSDLELEKDTIAVFQAADDLYIHRRFAIDGFPLKPEADSDKAATTSAAAPERYAKTAPEGAARN